MGTRYQPTTRGDVVTVTPFMRFVIRNAAADDETDIRACTMAAAVPITSPDRRWSAHKHKHKPTISNSNAPPKPGDGNGYRTAVASALVGFNVQYHTHTHMASITLSTCLRLRHHHRRHQQHRRQPVAATVLHRLFHHQVVAVVAVVRRTSTRHCFFTQTFVHAWVPATLLCVRRPERHQLGVCRSSTR